MKKKLTPAQKQAREKRTFKNKIVTSFKAAGFEYLNTDGIHIRIGNRTVEVDFVLIYKNIVLICEDTATQTEALEHIRKKQEAFTQIEENFQCYLQDLRNRFANKVTLLSEFADSRYKPFFLYFSQNKIKIPREDLKRYPKIKFIEPHTIEYFSHMSKCIKKSTRYEIFRFLGLSNTDIGLPCSEQGDTKISAPIIYPDDTTGLTNGVKIVSFMISAESLLETSYVLRKDNWEDSMWLYQRLVEPKKIKGIREFLSKKGSAFFNNIIVALPDGVRFLDSHGRSVGVDSLEDFEACKMVFPKEYNSICVIDGQHRIYAHHEANENDKYEIKIRELRKKLHLLVTGLIFPESMGEMERVQLQSSIFLEINSNAKPVTPEVLLHIESLKNPFSDLGIARQVIESLNKESLFLDMFEMSSLDKSRIKISSIIKFALRYLVSINREKESIYYYWDGDKEGIKNKNEKALKEYIEFITKLLREYFSAVRNNAKDDWLNPESKILSVTSINGFIIAFTKQLEKNGIKDYNFYNSCLKNLKVDFSKEAFRYTSSQYRKFSVQILREVFAINEAGS